MEAYFKMLDSYRGRDKILRLATFAAMTVSSGMNGQSAQRLQLLAGEISAARTVLRLFDGLPMLKRMLDYGCGSREKSTVLRVLTLLSNWSIQAFYPFEHLAWAGRHRILPVNDPGKWGVASVAMWAIYLVTAILKSLIKLPHIRRTRGKLRKQKSLDSKDGETETTDQNEVITWSLKQLKYEEMTEILSLVQNLSDLANAVHWLPKGFFWAGKLSMLQSGIMGLISTSVMIYSTSLQPPKHE